MNAGDLKQRLIFQQPDGGYDNDGFPIIGPITYAKARAKLKTLRGKTFHAAATSNMEHNREFTIRYQEKLTDGIRPKGILVVWKGVEHEVTSIENDDGLNVSMTVVAVAVS